MKNSLKISDDRRRRRRCGRLIRCGVSLANAPVSGSFLASTELRPDDATPAELATMIESMVQGEPAMPADVQDALKRILGAVPPLVFTFRLRRRPRRPRDAARFIAEGMPPVFTVALPRQIHDHGAGAR